MSKRIKTWDVNSPERIANTLLAEAARNEKLVAEATKKSLADAKRMAEEHSRQVQRELESKLSREVSTTNARIQAIDRIHTENLRKQVSIINSAIENSNKYFDNRIDASNKRLNNKISKLAETVNERIDNIYDSLNKTIKDVNERFSGIDDVLENQQEQIQNIYNNIANEHQRANDYRNDLIDLMNIIEKRCPHQKYAEREWQYLVSGIRSIVNSTEGAQSVIAESRGMIRDLLKFEDDILQKQIKFEVIYNIAIGEVEKVISLMVSNNNRFFVDQQGNKIVGNDGEKFKIEVDFWTKGEFSKLEMELDALRTELKTQKDSQALTEQRIIEITKQVNAIEIKQNNCLIKAAQLGMSSQLRLETCESALAAMEENGYWIKTINSNKDAFNYKGGLVDCDQREGVYAILENGSGSEITIMVDQDDSNPETHKLTFHRNDNQTLTDLQYRSRLDSIAKILTKDGYQSSSGFATPQGSDGDTLQPELADSIALERAKQKK